MGKKRSIGLDELLVEAHLLSRPCLALNEKRTSEPFVGIWGGKGVLEPPPGPFKHWLTVDCAWLAKQSFPFTGLLGVYQNEEDFVTGVVVHKQISGYLKRPFAGVSSILGMAVTRGAVSVHRATKVFGYSGERRNPCPRSTLFSSMAARE